MRTRILILSGCLVAGLVASACSKEDKPDPAQFTAICEEVVRCDAQVRQIPDPAKACGQLLASVQEKYPQKLPELESCLKAQSCEKKNIAECFANVVQGIGGVPTP
ncbi:MAG: hypothetical protein K1X75_10885 [Leptospirales bacterium]|nr:hypothetical protein [Leptospirales bacterium]